MSRNIWENGPCGPIQMATDYPRYVAERAG